ncbi:MAG: hypothetical protein KBT89_15940 [Gammaproteobacteria bacterium]|nr:hypothetical protein [Gammaproteobacteria bacterium]
MSISCTGQVTYSAPVGKGVILIKIRMLEPTSVTFKEGQFKGIVDPELVKQKQFSVRYMRSFGK